MGGRSKRLTDDLIEVRHSNVHGRGAFARRPLPSGTIVGSYRGRRFSPDEVRDVAWDSSLTYLYELSDGSYIDGGQGGNATRHLNHSCEPNCEAYEVLLPSGRTTVRFRTIQAVEAGQELYVDYQLSIDDEECPSSFPCRCGMPACRGSLVAPAD